MIQPSNPDPNINLKTSTYTALTKHVKGPNDSAFGTTSNVNIGDELTYQLSFIVPNTSAYPAGSTVKIVDTLPAGLELSASNAFTAALDGAAFTVAAPVISGQTITFTIPVSDLPAIDYSKTLAITYQATVLDTATSNNSTLTNTATMTQDTITGSPAEVSVYTYGIELTKVDESGVKLPGAQFVIYNPTSKTYLTFDSNGQYLGTANDAAAQSGATTLTTDANGNISVFGIAAGDYTLIETVAPGGYNLAPDTNITIDNTTGASYVAYKTASVIDVSAIQLPSTGGAGTVVITVVGIGIVVLAGLFLFLNRKKLFGK